MITDNKISMLFENFIHLLLIPVNTVNQLDIKQIENDKNLMNSEEIWLSKRYCDRYYDFTYDLFQNYEEYFSIIFRALKNAIAFLQMQT